MRTRSVRRAPAVVLLATLMGLLLSGCGDGPPAGAASVVGGTRIDRSDVTELAQAQCDGIRQAAKSGQSQSGDTPRKQLTQQALTLLMDIELNLQYGKKEDVSARPQEVAATYSQVEPLIKALPAKYQDFMSSTFHRWAAGRDILTQIGVQATGQQPDASNTDQLLNAGYQKRAPWLKTVQIDTDPRYGPAGVGWPGGADPSVSKAVSSFAKSADAKQPGEAWVSALPNSQKCG